MALDAFSPQHAVEPKTIKASLVDDDNREALSPVQAYAFGRSLAKSSKRPLAWPVSTECFDIFSPLPGDSEPAVFTLRRVDAVSG